MLGLPKISKIAEKIREENAEKIKLYREENAEKIKESNKQYKLEKKR